jgi:hypothetical protein
MMLVQGTEYEDKSLGSVLRQEAGVNGYIIFDRVSIPLTYQLLP